MVRAVVDCRLSPAAAARQFNTTPKTVAEWVKRFRAEGLHDRPRDYEKMLRLFRPFPLPLASASLTTSRFESVSSTRKSARAVVVPRSRIMTLFQHDSWRRRVSQASFLSHNQADDPPLSCRNIGMGCLWPKPTMGRGVASISSDRAWDWPPSIKVGGTKRNLALCPVLRNPAELLLKHTAGANVLGLERISNPDVAVALRRRRKDVADRNGGRRQRR